VTGLRSLRPLLGWSLVAAGVLGLVLGQTSRGALLVDAVCLGLGALLVWTATAPTGEHL
jgi:hypothetical protein